MNEYEVLRPSALTFDLLWGFPIKISVSERHGFDLRLERRGVSLRKIQSYVIR
jgi:hypothetical protein